jgi:hypothetical protein
MLPGHHNGYGQFRIKLIRQNFIRRKIISQKIYVGVPNLFQIKIIRQIYYL